VLRSRCASTSSPSSTRSPAIASRSARPIEAGERDRPREHRVEHRLGEAAGVT
jgi:hypothetical protein